MPNTTKTLQPALHWFRQRNWKPFPFQQEAWAAYLAGKSGLVNAPTGSGKTYSLFFGPDLEYLAEIKNTPAPPPRKTSRKKVVSSIGLRVLWITPVRALAKEIQQSTQCAANELGLDWEVLFNLFQCHVERLYITDLKD